MNEAFLRLIADEPVEWASRTQFYAFAARLMRQILIDFARGQDTDKRGHRSSEFIAGDGPGSSEPIHLGVVDISYVYSFRLATSREGFTNHGQTF